VANRYRTRQRPARQRGHLADKLHHPVSILVMGVAVFTILVWLPRCAG